MTLSNMPTNEIQGMVAIMLSFCGYVPYFLGIYRGTIHPHGFTWLAWGAVTGIIAAASLLSGAGNGSWSTAISSVMCLLVAFLALRRGTTIITWSDWLILGAIAAALLSWCYTRNPLGAVILLTSVDVLAFIPTIRKSWLKPHEEEVQTYVLGALKFGLILLSLDHVTITTALYPASQVIMFSLLVVMLLYRASNETVL